MIGPYYVFEASSARHLRHNAAADSTDKDRSHVPGTACFENIMRLLIVRTRTGLMCLKWLPSISFNSQLYKFCNFLIFHLIFIGFVTDCMF